MLQLSLELTGKISADNSETVKSDSNSFNDSSEVSGFTWISGVQACGEERGAMATTGVRHVIRKKFSFLEETGVSIGECFPAKYI